MFTGLLPFLLLACLGGGLCCPVLAGDLPLTPVPELLATPRVEAAKRPAMKVRGTISLIGEGLASPAKNPASLASFCLEKAETGIWVSVATALREGVWEGNREIFLTLHEGLEIEMEGVLDAGAFAPIFLPARLRVIGEKPLPPAKAVSLFRLMSGAADVQRVVVTGVVQRFVEENDSRWLVKVETGLGHFLARLPRTPAFDPARLLDAEVKMTGLAAVSRNWRSEFVCPRLIISREQDVEILRIPPPDAFAAQKLPLSALDAYSPKGRPRHRRRIEGTLTYQVPGSFLFLQEGNCAVRVESSSPLGLTPGDRVEATGFIDTSRNVAGLSGALIRRTGTAALPAPVPITMPEISGIFALMKAGRTARLPGCDGLLVSVRGKLLSLQGPAADGLQRLELDCGDAITTAFLKGPTGALLPGSQLQASGIATLQYAPGGQTANFTEPLRLDLLLRDVSDIKVLSAPSWWTTTRIWSALLGVLALAAVILTWAVMLRRTVARQTRLLAQEMRGRRDAAVEFQAALRERSRLAANLHDTVLQTMTGIGYQMEACEAESLPEAERPANHLETARRMVQRGQEDLRNSVWALRALPLNERDFADAVRRVARQISAGHPVEILVERPAALPPLADFIAGNLLLIVQEATHNALKHARPTNVRISLSAMDSGQRFRLTVHDDGSGFLPGSQPGIEEGHFGLEGMRERAERLDGTLKITSGPGTGTSLTVEVPLRSFDHDLTEPAASA